MSLLRKIAVRGPRKRDRDGGIARDESINEVMVGRRRMQGPFTSRPGSSGIAADVRSLERTRNQARLVGDCLSVHRVVVSQGYCQFVIKARRDRRKKSRARGSRKTRRKGEEN